MTTTSTDHPNAEPASVGEETIPAEPKAPARDIATFPHIYPAEVRGRIAEEPQHDAAGQRRVESRLIVAGDLPALSAAGNIANLVVVRFPVPVHELRVVLGTDGMALAIGFGRTPTADDFDDLVRYVPEGVTIRVPGLKHFGIGNISATAADASSVIVGSTVWT